MPWDILYTVLAFVAAIIVAIGTYLFGTASAKRSGRQLGRAEGDTARATDRADAQAEVVDAQRRMAEADARGARDAAAADRRLRDGTF